jgi:hypothetical protein
MDRWTRRPVAIVLAGGTGAYKTARGEIRCPATTSVYGTTLRATSLVPWPDGADRCDHIGHPTIGTR